MDEVYYANGLATHYRELEKGRRGFLQYSLVMQQVYAASRRSNDRNSIWM